MRPVVRIRPLQKPKLRPSGNYSHTVIWSLDGVETTRSFPDDRQAATFRFELETALRAGVEFDRKTGLPVTATGGDVTFLEWSIRYFAKEWSDLAPRTRDTYVEDLSRWIPVVCADRAPPAPAGMWGHLYSVLVPIGAECKLKAVPSLACAAWLAKWSPLLSDLDPAMMDAAEVRLRVGPGGVIRSKGTLTKWRRGAHTVISEAIRLGVMEKSPWPVAKKGRRKSTRRASSTAIDITTLPAVSMWAPLLASIVSHQPGSWMYRAMTAVGLYAGLRPSETVEVTVADLHLPASGWGTIWVDKAWDGYHLPGDPKTTERLVPIPPQLVTELRLWLTRSGLESGPLFRTREGGRPSQSNWNRALARAAGKLSIDPPTPYDLRHSCASVSVGNGAPLPKIAAWLGHSVETLTKTYTHAMPGDTSRAQSIMDSVYAAAELID